MVFSTLFPPSISVAEKNGESVSIKAAYYKGSTNCRLKLCVQVFVHLHAQFNISEAEQQKFAPF